MTKELFIATTSFGKYSDTLSLLRNKKIIVKKNFLNRKLKKNEIVRLAKNSDYIIAGTEKYNKTTLAKLKKLKFIFRIGSGIDNIDINFAKKKNIKVLSSKITPEKAVAELVVGLIINLLREINQHDRNLKINIWKKEMGYLLHKKTVGIIGYGKIGKYLKKILKSFGTRVIINDIKYKSKKSFNLKDLISESDIISVHINYDKKNKNLLNSNILKMLKKNSILINTSRAEVIDYNFLYELLKRKKILGAALDVFENEPYQGKFQKLNNVILTPHIGSYAREIRSEMELEAIGAILKSL